MDHPEGADSSRLSFARLYRAGLMDHPEGADSERCDRVDFDRRVRLEFRGYTVQTADFW